MKKRQKKSEKVAAGTAAAAPKKTSYQQIKCPRCGVVNPKQQHHIQHIRIVICPRCTSDKITPHSKTRHTVEHGDVLEAYYSTRICANCGYSGFFFPEVPIGKLEQIRKEIKKLRSY